jgi:hypothetical protein
MLSKLVDRFSGSGSVREDEPAYDMTEDEDDDEDESKDEEGDETRND